MECVALFDIYRGRQVPEGFTGQSYCLTYRRGDRTLTDSEVNERHRSVTRALEEKLGVKIRGGI